MRIFRKTEKRPQKYAEPRKKLTITYLAVAAVLFALSVYLLVLMKNNGEEYQMTILSQQGYSSSTVPFRRGSITDRNGIVLAYSEEVYNLILDPSVILYTMKASNPQPNREATVRALVEVYGLDREKIEKTLDKNPSSAYIRYVDSLSAEEMNAFLEYQSNYNNARAGGKKLHTDKVTGVWFETEYKREYPYSNLACSVLGFSKGEAGTGHWGLEEYYNDTLSGTDGKVYSYINSDGDYETVTEPSVGGSTLVSTIDYNVQKAVESNIRAFIEEGNEYKDIGVVVMDPANGEILGMASDKSFDLNKPDDFSSLYTKEEWENLPATEKNLIRNSTWRNFTISDAYTPGSVSKELTVAMALEENLVDEESIFDCDGGENVQGQYIGCNSVHGTLSLMETLMYSCNDSMMNLASRMNVSTMLKWQRAFGLGARTGIDLPGESAGILFDEKAMSAVDMASCSFGQGYSSTMIQMAAAYCSMINGGYYYQPHTVRQILDENGGLLETVKPNLVRTTVTERTCSFLKKAAFETVDNGTAGAGRIEGYFVAGKTGTAQKYPLTEQRYVVSFMAFTPVETPQLLVYVVINEPSHEGSSVSNRGAVLLEQSIMNDILPYLGIPKTR